jgi:hypothetical protein
MIRCVKIERLLDVGACRPFLARNSQGGLLVVKPHAKAHNKTDLFTKPLFNEFIGSSLAMVIGLPWPDVSLVLLEAKVIGQLERAGYSIISDLAVGLNYIEGLKAFRPPHGSVERTRYLKDSFPESQKHTSFYGKSVFDNWVLLEDWKYDTLQIRQNGSPVFLDASMAFGGLDWDTSLLQWVEHRMHFDRSPYLSGFLNDFSQFDPWLKKLQSTGNKVYSQILRKIPLEWSVSADYIAAVGELLALTAKCFVPIFKEKIEWEKESQLS